MKGMTLGLVLATAVAISAAEPPSLPRTADGHPDLQGTWSYATLTTLERPMGTRWSTAGCGPFMP